MIISIAILLNRDVISRSPKWHLVWGLSSTTGSIIKTYWVPSVESCISTIGLRPASSAANPADVHNLRVFIRAILLCNSSSKGWLLPSWDSRRSHVLRVPFSNHSTGASAFSSSPAILFLKERLLIIPHRRLSSRFEIPIVGFNCLCKMLWVE